jgi:hypothetical protein
MNEKNRKWTARTGQLSLAILLLLGLVSCATVYGGSVKGRAVDADTGKPLTNAVAYGVWVGTRTSIMRSDGVCAWLESTRLDAQGGFRLHAWSKWGVEAFMTSGVQRSVVVYAPGYELAIVSNEDPLDVKMRRFVGTVDERFMVLKTPFCPEADGDHRLALVSLMMADEMEHLAVTDMQHRQAQSARENANMFANGSTAGH